MKTQQKPRTILGFCNGGPSCFLNLPSSSLSTMSSFQVASECCLLYRRHSNCLAPNPGSSPLTHTCLIPTIPQRASKHTLYVCSGCCNSMLCTKGLKEQTCLQFWRLGVQSQVSTRLVLSGVSLVDFQISMTSHG